MDRKINKLTPCFVWCGKERLDRPAKWVGYWIKKDEWRIQRIAIIKIANGPVVPVHSDPIIVNAKKIRAYTTYYGTIKVFR